MNTPNDVTDEQLEELLKRAEELPPLEQPATPHPWPRVKGRFLPHVGYHKGLEPWLRANEGVR